MVDWRRRDWGRQGGSDVARGILWRPRICSPARAGRTAILDQNSEEDGRAAEKDLSSGGARYRSVRAPARLAENRIAERGGDNPRGSGTGRVALHHGVKHRDSEPDDRLRCT